MAPTVRVRAPTVRVSPLTPLALLDTVKHAARSTRLTIDIWFFLSKTLGKQKETTVRITHMPLTRLLARRAAARHEPTDRHRDRYPRCCCRRCPLRRPPLRLLPPPCARCWSCCWVTRDEERLPASRCCNLPAAAARAPRASTLRRVPAQAEHKAAGNRARAPHAHPRTASGTPRA